MNGRFVGAYRETDVVIAGGGPIGLALSVELGHRGISCVVVEPRARTRLVPRAKLANVRTMEHLRRWGLADEVRRVTPLPADYSTEVAFVTSLLGHEITRFANVFATRPERDDRFAEPAQQVPQYILEPVLRDHAAELESVAFLDGWRVDEVSEGTDGVQAVVHDADGAERIVRGRYLVGCDGGASTVRRQLGITMLGRRSIARNYGVVFRSAELARILPFAPALHFWTVNATTPCYMGPGDRRDLWWMQATAIDPAVDMRQLVPQEVVRGAVGASVELEVINVDPWEAHALTADRVREGRSFLAGDAAHQHTPMGAHGMNQGIGDAVDLGWKLAAVLDGWAAAGLLDSYAAERGPLHARVTDEATANYGALSNHYVGPGLERDGLEGARLREELAGRIQREKAREFYSLGLVLGHVYEGSPVVIADGSPSPAPEVETFTPRPRPGGRTPHAWMPDGSSLFDQLGEGLTLLRLDPDANGDPIESAARDRGIPLRTVSVEAPEVIRVFERRLALVRPDQVLVWHGDEAPADAGAMLDVVVGRGA